MIDPESLNRKNNERGATAIMIAVALVALIGFGSLAVDIGMGLVVRSELQNVSDAAALAGTRQLAQYYKANPNKIQSDLSGQLGTVRSKAQEYAALNKGGGISISVPDEDVLFGKYAPSTGAITATNTGVRLIQVTSRRDDDSNGTVSTGLANVLGINEMAVRARSAAALTPLQTLASGQGDFPIGISKQWFDTHKCNDPDKIKLYPTEPNSCAGWHTFDSKPASSAKLKGNIDKMLAGTFVSPPDAVAGKTEYEFMGGVADSVCDPLKNLFDAKKVSGKWRVNVPVYDLDCSNPNKRLLILGFVQADVTDVSCAPNPKKIEIQVKCNIVDSTVGTGGGANDYGLLSMTASMVN